MVFWLCVFKKGFSDTQWCVFPGEMAGYRVLALKHNSNNVGSGRRGQIWRWWWWPRPSDSGDNTGACAATWDSELVKSSGQASVNSVSLDRGLLPETWRVCAVRVPRRPDVLRGSSEQREPAPPHPVPRRLPSRLPCRNRNSSLCLPPSIISLPLCGWSGIWLFFKGNFISKGFSFCFFWEPFLFI